MYEYREKNHVARGIIAGILVFVILVLAAGAGAFFYKKYHTDDETEKTPAVTTGQVIGDDETLMNDGEIHALPLRMLFSPGPSLRGEDPVSETFQAVVQATLYPANVADPEVDWSVQYVNPNSTFASSHSISEIVEVEPTEDGSRIATVSCLQPFAEQIRLTVTSRYNPAISATCLLDYKQQFLGYELRVNQRGNNSRIVVDNTNHTGTLVPDFWNDNALEVWIGWNTSDVFTVLLSDSEVTKPGLTIQFNNALATALNNVKSGMGSPIVCSYLYGSVIEPDFFNEDWLEGLTAGEINGVVAALEANLTNSVYFDLTDGDNLLVRYTFSMIADELEYQLESISLNQSALVFGNTNETYTITYRRAGFANAPTLFEIGSEYGLSKQTGGNYPETYQSGEEITISNLKTNFSCSGPSGQYHSGNGASPASYRFNGWYWDDDMTMPFDGTIPADMIGNITLYADIDSTSTHGY